MSKYASELAFWRDLKDRPEHKPDGRYLQHLLLDADAFAGMRVLEVGCGPLSWALDFVDCELWGLDPLIEQYRELGYAMDSMNYVQGYAEDMPFDDGEFDACISFNALDHVDDFPKAAGEIERVVRPEGIIRVEIHYHRPFVCEPLELNDDIVRSSFTRLEKVCERPYGDTFFPGHPESPSYEGTVALWSTPL